MNKVRFDIKEEKTMKEIITVIGGGGKTSCICRQIEEIKRAKGLGIVMTTTKMFHPKDWPFVEIHQPSDLSYLKKVIKKEGVVWVGRPFGEEKITDIPTECREEIFSWDIPVFIEGDGSKRKPLKIQGENEPVVPKETTKTILVAGLDSVGEPLFQVCHRWELAGEAFGWEKDHIVTTEDVVSLLTMEEGMKKNVQGELRILLNKADSEKRLHIGKEIKRCLQEKGFLHVELGIQGKALHERNDDRKKEPK